MSCFSITFIKQLVNGNKQTATETFYARNASSKTEHKSQGNFTVGSRSLIPLANTEIKILLHSLAPDPSACAFSSLSLLSSSFAFLSSSSCFLKRSAVVAFTADCNRQRKRQLTIMTCITVFYYYHINKYLSTVLFDEIYLWSNVCNSTESETKDYRIPKTCHSYSFEWGKMQRSIFMINHRKPRLLNERANH